MMILLSMDSDLNYLMSCEVFAVAIRLPTIEEEKG